LSILRLKQSEATAARRRLPIRMVDATDGITAETGISFTTGDLSISKNGAAQALGAGTYAEIGSGDYYYEAQLLELDTLGFLRYHVAKSGSRDFVGIAQVMLDDPYASGGGSATAAAVADAVWDELRADHVGGATFGEGAASVQGNVTGSVGSLGATAKADVNAEVDSALNTAIPAVPVADSVNERIQTMDTTTLPAIKAKTDNLPSAPVKNQGLNNFPYFLRFPEGTTYQGVSAGTADIARDAGAWAGSTNAPVLLGFGFARITLTAAEMNGDVVRLRALAGTAEAAISFLTRPA